MNAHSYGWSLYEP